ncbi:MAG: DNA alkylation repair protein [bacterium]
MSFNIDGYIADITQALEEKSNSKYAEKQKDYMKGNFDFIGVKAQPRRKATRVFVRKAERPEYDDIDIVVKKLWKLPEREYQYFAIELIERYKKEFDKDMILLFEYMITNKSWWDTVDLIAKKLVGEFFKSYPQLRDEYIARWLNSDDMWLQRTCLLFQLGYKENTDSELLFDLVKQLKDEDEFFIKKAIGWALREYSKTDSEKVKKFIQNHSLSSLSEREGLKWIKKNKE